MYIAELALSWHAIVTAADCSEFWEDGCTVQGLDCDSQSCGPCSEVIVSSSLADALSCCIVHMLSDVSGSRDHL